MNISKEPKQECKKPESDSSLNSNGPKKSHTKEIASSKAASSSFASKKRARKGKESMSRHVPSAPPPEPTRQTFQKTPKASIDGTQQKLQQNSTVSQGDSISSSNPYHHSIDYDYRFFHHPPQYPYPLHHHHHPLQATSYNNYFPHSLTANNNHHHQAPTVTDDLARTCNYCKKIGHWKIDCRKLAWHNNRVKELKKTQEINHKVLFQSSTPSAMKGTRNSNLLNQEKQVSHEAKLSNQIHNRTHHELLTTKSVQNSHSNDGIKDRFPLRGTSKLLKKFFNLEKSAKLTTSISYPREKAVELDEKILADTSNTNLIKKCPTSKPNTTKIDSSTSQSTPLSSSSLPSNVVVVPKIVNTRETTGKDALSKSILKTTLPLTIIVSLVICSTLIAESGAFLIEAERGEFENLLYEPVKWLDTSIPIEISQKETKISLLYGKTCNLAMIQAKSFEFNATEEEFLNRLNGELYRRCLHEEAYIENFLINILAEFNDGGKRKKKGEIIAQSTAIASDSSNIGVVGNNTQMLKKQKYSSSPKSNSLYHIDNATVDYLIQHYKNETDSNFFAQLERSTLKHETTRNYSDYRDLLKFLENTRFLLKEASIKLTSQFKFFSLIISQLTSTIQHLTMREDFNRFRELASTLKKGYVNLELIANKFSDNIVATEKEGKENNELLWKRYNSLKAEQLLLSSVDISTESKIVDLYFTVPIYDTTSVLKESIVFKYWINENEYDLYLDVPKYALVNTTNNCWHFYPIWTNVRGVTQFCLEPNGRIEFPDRLLKRNVKLTNGTRIRETAPIVLRLGQSLYSKRKNVMLVQCYQNFYTIEGRRRECPIYIMNFDIASNIQFEKDTRFYGTEMATKEFNLKKIIELSGGDLMIILLMVITLILLALNLTSLLKMLQTPTRELKEKKTSLTKGIQTEDISQHSSDNDDDESQSPNSTIINIGKFNNSMRTKYKSQYFS